MALSLEKARTYLAIAASIFFSRLSRASAARVSVAVWSPVSAMTAQTWRCCRLHCFADLRTATPRLGFAYQLRHIARIGKACGRSGYVTTLYCMFADLRTGSPSPGVCTRHYEKRQMCCLQGESRLLSLSEALAGVSWGVCMECTRSSISITPDIHPPTSIAYAVRSRFTIPHRNTKDVSL